LKNYNYIYILLVSFAFGNTIIHEKIDIFQYGVTIPIQAYLNISQNQVHRFTLLYRSEGNNQYIETNMKKMGKYMYLSEIPGSFVIRNTIEYYLLLELIDGSHQTFPEKYKNEEFISIHINGLLDEQQSGNNTQNENNQFNIDGIEPNVTIISPKPNENILKQDLFIALSFFKIKNIDIENIKVFLDDVDVRFKSRIDSLYLSINSDAITPGLHTVRVNIANTFGQKFKDISWSFTVLPGNKLNLESNKKNQSNVSLSYVSGRADERLLSFGELNYNYDIDFDWLTLDLNITKSTLENRYEQYRDNYKVNLQNDYMKIKLGDSYPNIDQYSWSGHGVRGVNLIFEKGPFYLNIVNGKTKRAVQGNPFGNSMIVSSLDSSNNSININLSRKNYAFEQKAFAAKLKIDLNKFFLWDVNYIQVRDNVESVSNEIINAEIDIPNILVDNIKPEINTKDYFSDTNRYKIKYEVLKNNYRDIFNNVENIFISDKFWDGEKPEDNFIFGSNFKFSFDQSKIQLSSGFSLSLFNGNKWNNIDSILELDTLANDLRNDLNFFQLVELDSSLDILKYKNNFSFGSAGQPLIPFILKNDTLTLSDFFKISSLNKYTNIKLLYLGHRLEIGYIENGPDYHSILNPFLRSNYKENYFSDGFNLFQNKLLFFYKRSLISERIYEEDQIPIKTKKDLFSLSLYPGSELPSFNFNFSTFYKSNGLENLDVIGDSVFIAPLDGNILTESSLQFKNEEFDQRIDLASKQMNISMTNQFSLFGKQYLSFHYYLLDQEDLIAKSIIQSEEYFPNNAFSESYGLSIKSIYNKFWESSVYLNNNMYKYGISKSYGYVNQKLIEYQFKVVKKSTKKINMTKFGINYSLGRGSQYITQYNFNFGINLEPLKKVNINLYIDYRIKYLGRQEKSKNDFFFRTNMYYDIK
jgi:hypothetical protein